MRERRPDLVVATGDLLSRPRGRAQLDETLKGLDAFAVLGNHDIAVTRDPFSRPAELEGLPATLLLDESQTVERRGRRIQIAGMGPHPVGAVPAADADAALRVLLSHYPRLTAPGYQLVLAGHMHAGQIVLPLSGRKDPLRPSPGEVRRGVVPARGSDAPRLTRPRHDVSAHSASSPGPR